MDEWADGEQDGWLGERRKRESRVQVTVSLFGRVSFSPDNRHDAGFALMDLLSIEMLCISAWAHHASVINQITASV